MNYDTYQSMYSVMLDLNGLYGVGNSYNNSWLKSRVIMSLIFYHKIFQKYFLLNIWSKLQSATEKTKRNKLNFIYVLGIIK